VHATTNNRWIVGITGKNASGKGVAAEALMGAGYAYRSLSDALRIEAEKLGVSHSREDLIRLGQSLRKKEGPGVLAARTAAAFDAQGLYVVDSIRNPVEIDILKASGHFILLGIDAPIALRYERAMKRGRNESAQTLEQFQKMEERECSNDELGQQLNKCLERVDFLLQNDTSVTELAQTVLTTVRGASFPV